MTALERTSMRVGLSALVYLTVLAISGELHPSSKAFVFFAILWSVQAAGDVWRAWHRTRSPRQGVAAEQ
jgi:hypothetical protein